MPSAVTVASLREVRPTRTLYTDKRKQKTSNGNAEVQSRRDDGKIVAETKFGQIKVVETFALAAEGQQLVVTVKMDGAGGGRGGDRAPAVRHVYDRAANLDPPAR